MLRSSVWTVVATLLSVSTLVADDVSASRKATPRRPVAITAIGDRLFIANQRTGTISVLNARTQTPVIERPVAEELADLVALPGKERLLALDSARHQMLLLQPKENSIEVLARVTVPRHPVRMSVTGDGTRVAVASLWSRRLSFVRVPSKSDPANSLLSVERVIDLEFAPRELIALPYVSPEGARREWLIVADGFGGQLMVLEPETGRILGTPTLAGHNLRGLAYHPPQNESSANGQLLVAHQVLNSNTSTTHEHVFWGAVIGNRIRSLALSELLQDRRGEPTPGSVDVLGRPSAAAGDPSGIAVTSRGATIVALSGINEVAVRRGPNEVFTQIAVGRRPTAIALLDEQRTAAVLNTLDDSVSLIDLDELTVTRLLELGPRAERSLADRGERLFYDSRLSLDGWYSCHSCHTDGHTNSLLNDNLGDEYFGAPKKILSLLGTGETSPWAWNGGSPSLEAQLEKSLRVTMQADGDDVTEENIQALKAFLATFTPPPGIDVARGTMNEADVAAGKAVFRSQGCVDCHAPATYTTPGTFDVGIHDELGKREFNPPSLRGVSQRAPYFHDNRAPSLEAVLDVNRHGLKKPLSGEERRKLLAFLRSL